MIESFEALEVISQHRNKAIVVTTMTASVEGHRHPPIQTWTYR